MIIGRWWLYRIRCRLLHIHWRRCHWLRCGRDRSCASPSLERSGVDDAWSRTTSMCYEPRR
jgi:hypothetical protein